jgi:hypothetical protein
MGGWLLLLLAGSSATLTMVCAVFVWRLRPHPAARVFAYFMAAQTVACIGYTGELLARTLESKVLWDNMQFLAWVAYLPLLLWFTWEYAQIVPKALGRTLGLFTVIPALACGWVLTDPLHGRARASAHIVKSPPFDSLIYDFTFLELLFILQSYLVALYVLAIITRVALEHPRGVRAQAAMVGFGLALPLAANTLGMFRHDLLGQRDVAPICFGLAALPITWALHRGRFLNIVPIARHVVFDHIPDPVLVLDHRERIVDLNPAAGILLGSADEILGQAAAKFVPQWTVLTHSSS